MQAPRPLPLTLKTATPPSEAYQSKSRATHAASAVQGQGFLYWPSNKQPPDLLHAFPQALSARRPSLGVAYTRCLVGEPVLIPSTRLPPPASPNYSTTHLRPIAVLTQARASPTHRRLRAPDLSQHPGKAKQASGRDEYRRQLRLASLVFCTPPCVRLPLETATVAGRQRGQVRTCLSITCLV